MILLKQKKGNILNEYNECLVCLIYKDIFHFNNNAKLF